MGSPEVEADRQDGEVPHEVHISRPFLIGVHEVTQEEFRKVMSATVKRSAIFHEKCGGGPDHPMENLLWKQAAVIARQTHRGKTAVVVDGGVHQRGDLCGVGLRQKAISKIAQRVNDGPSVPTDVLGCLSLPSDILVEAEPLPPLAPGDVLAFPNACAYGLYASPGHFHGHPLTAEVASEGSRIDLLRARLPVSSILDGQTQ